MLTYIYSYTRFLFLFITIESYLTYTLHLALFIRYSFSSRDKIHTMKLTISLHSSISESESYSSCVRLFATPWLYTVHGILQARIPEWVAVPFSRESSQPRDQTQVSLTAGRFFTSWGTREALCFKTSSLIVGVHGSRLGPSSPELSTQSQCISWFLCTHMMCFQE